MTQILLVGAGNMGFAMLSRWATSSPYSFSVVESSAASRARAGEIGIPAWAEIAQVPEHMFDVLIVATKPQVVLDVVDASQRLLADGGFLISVAAGITTSSIGGRAVMQLPVVRCMPNTPALVGEAMTVCYANELVTPRQRELVAKLMSSIGLVDFIEDENLLDAVTAVSGSGPAYLFYFIEALAEAAVETGIEKTLALRLAKQTVYGAAKLATEDENPPDSLRKMVTSPNGTTAAALDILMRENGGLSEIISQAVSCAQRRSQELRGAI